MSGFDHQDTDDGPITLRQETEAQQRRALLSMAPAAVIMLALFVVAGYGKYWEKIPLTGGIAWGLGVAGLFSAVIIGWHRERSGRVIVSNRQVHRTAAVYAGLLGVMIGIGSCFGLLNEGLEGRVTFAVMIVGLGGVVLSVAYMVPVISACFYAPLFAAMFLAAPLIDPHVSLFQKYMTILVLMALFALLIRFNWRLFQSGVKAAVDRERHHYEVLERRAEMDAARRIQMGLLPSAGQALKEEARFDLAAQLEPAQEMTGDLYDFFMVDKDRLFFLVGDVCGKGVTSSLLMAITKTVVKNAVLRRDQHLGEMMTEVNRELMRAEHEGQFVTCVVGVLDLTTGIIRFTNAGHEPMLLLRDGGEIEASPRVGGPPLCTLDGMIYETGTIHLHPGDALLAVSDGVTEAELLAGKPLGQEGLTALLRRLPDDARPAIIIEAIQQHLAAGIVSAPDDRTLLAIRYHTSRT